MRAVVLPQGRFMEFLHLQGTDREPGEEGWIDHVAFGPFDFAAKKAELEAAGVRRRSAASKP